MPSEQSRRSMEDEMKPSDNERAGKSSDEKNLDPFPVTAQEEHETATSEEDDVEEEEEKFLPFHMEYLTPKMEHELRYKLKERDNKERDLEAFKELIAKEENLFARSDEEFLLQFLRARKYDVKRAFQLMQNYYSFRKEFKHIYTLEGVEEDKMRAIVYRNFLGFLRYRDRAGAVVFVGKAGKWDPDIDTFEDCFRTITCCVLHAIELPATQVAGFRAIFDIRGLTWKQMKYATPFNLYLIIRSLLNCFPGRYKGVHVLTENRFFQYLYAMMYPFLTKKIKNRLFFHGKDLSGIQKYIHPSVLPVEYGGQAEPFNNEAWANVVENEEKAQWFKDLLKHGYK